MDRVAGGHGAKDGEESYRPNETIIAYWYSMLIIILSSLFAAGWCLLERWLESEILEKRGYQGSRGRGKVRTPLQKERPTFAEPKSQR